MAKRTGWVTRHRCVLVLAAAFVGSTTASWLYEMGGSGRAAVEDSAVACPAPGADAESAELPIRTEIPTKGLPRKGASPTDARSEVIEMIECSDFDCPFSHRAAGTVDQLIERNEDLAFYHVHFPLPMHQHGKLKALAATAAQRQSAFWPMHDALFTAHVDSPQAATKLAARLGLDADRFAADLRDPALLAEVDRQMNLCRKASVRAVPTFFINGRRVVGSLPSKEFQRVIDEERR